MPFSKGGETTIENCQILQTRTNRWKSDKVGPTKEELRNVSCDMNLSGIPSLSLVHTHTHRERERETEREMVHRLFKGLSEGVPWAKKDHRESNILYSISPAYSGEV